MRTSIHIDGETAARCRRSNPIHADCNQPGESIVDYIPALAHLTQSDDRSFFAYASPNKARGTIAEILRADLARSESVATEDVIIDGSGLALIRQLPRIVGADGVVKLAGDFMGYGLAAVEAGVPLREAVAAYGEYVDPSGIISAASGMARPLVFLNFGPTNPSQSICTLEMITAVRKAIPDGVLVVNGAYAASISDRSIGCPDLAAFARETRGVVYLNVAAKALGLCGARISWMVAHADLRDRLISRVGPYCVAPKAAEMTIALLRRPDLVRAVHEVMSQATGVLRDGLSRMDLRTVSGPGPWVLAEFGDAASEIVERLARSMNIFVQDQGPLAPSLAGWIRISGTNPHEARVILDALVDVENDLGIRPALRSSEMTAQNQRRATA